MLDQSSISSSRNDGAQPGPVEELRARALVPAPGSAVAAR
jgi:hypothetical protein